MSSVIGLRFLCCVKAIGLEVFLQSHVVFRVVRG